VVLVLDIK